MIKVADIRFQKKHIIFFVLILAIWQIFHLVIGLITKDIGQPAFSAAAPILVDIIAMLIALMITKKKMLWIANIALIDIFLSALLGDFSALANSGREGLANTLYTLAILTCLMANAKYFGRKYFEKRFMSKKRKAKRKAK